MDQLLLEQPIIAIYLYCCTDLFKTPQEQFWSSLSKASKITGDKTYSEALNEIRNLKEKSYTLKGDAKFNISSTEEDEEVQKIEDAFSKIQISELPHHTFRRGTRAHSSWPSGNWNFYKIID